MKEERKKGEVGEKEGRRKKGRVRQKKGAREE